MAVDDEDIVLTDDKPARLERAPAERPEPPQTKTAPAEDDELATLRASIATKDAEAKAERDRRLSAERERDDARRRTEAEVSDHTSSKEIAINNAISAWSQEVASLKGAYASALARQDFNEAAEIQARLVDTSASIRDANREKQALANWKQQQVQAAEQQRQQPVDPLGALSPQSRQWLEAHPDIRPGSPQWTRAMGADQLAKGEGIVADSPQYFDRIETLLGLKQPTVAEVNLDDDEPPVRVRSTPEVSMSTPPSRGNGAGAPREESRIKLTKGERDTALAMTSLGKTPQERLEAYARSKRELQKEGRL